MTADLDQTLRLPHLPPLEAQLARLEATVRQALAKAAAETARADAETLRANAAEDLVGELEEQLADSRGQTAMWHARAEQAEDAERALRIAPTLQLPRVRGRRGWRRAR